MSKRLPVSVSPLLERRLTAYIAATSAAGLATLLATPQAEAKVVYTATNSTITANTPIDLNHDGVADFSLEFFQGFGHSQFLGVAPLVTGNAIKANGGAFGSAAAGFFGVPVGPGGQFGSNSYFGHRVMMAGFFQYSFSSFFGPWANATNRYLGFKFLINGEVHYGWARMSVTNALRTVVLTGYAYETEPNTKIIEGHLSGNSAANFVPKNMLAPVNPSPSLGMLARGADGLVLWRRERGAELAQ